MTTSQLSILPRRWWQRGHADHGWLYHDPRFQQFSNLRVINEDRVSAGKGFPNHPHREFEIFSIILKGSLEHRDNLGNVETLRRGDVQFTSAGTGIKHSEINKGTDQVHFLQIWYQPDVSGLPPKYYTIHVSDQEKRNQLKTLIKPVSSFTLQEQEQGQTIPSHSKLVTRSCILSSGKTVTHEFGKDSNSVGEGQNQEERWVYLHLAQTSGYKHPIKEKEKRFANEAFIQFHDGKGNLTKLYEGDGAFIKGGKIGQSFEIQNESLQDAEFVLFDLRPDN